MTTTHQLTCRWFSFKNKIPELGLSYTLAILFTYILYKYATIIFIDIAA